MLFLRGTPFSSQSVIVLYCRNQCGVGSSVVHKLMDAMSSAQKLRGASTLSAPQMAHAEVFRQCGADPAGGKIHAGGLLSCMSVGPVSSARGTWRFTGGTPRAPTSFFSHRSHSVLNLLFLATLCLALLHTVPKIRFLLPTAFTCSPQDEATCHLTGCRGSSFDYNSHLVPL